MTKGPRGDAGCAASVATATTLDQLAALVTPIDWNSTFVPPPQAVCSVRVAVPCGAMRRVKTWFVIPPLALVHAYEAESSVVPVWSWSVAFRAATEPQVPPNSETMVSLEEGGMVIRFSICAAGSPTKMPCGSLVPETVGAPSVQLKVVLPQRHFPG